MKMGIGLYEQLKPEYLKQIHEAWEERMKMTNEEKIQDVCERTLRGIALIKEAFTKMQQDANIKYITGNRVS